MRAGLGALAFDIFITTRGTENERLADRLQLLARYLILRIGPVLFPGSVVTATGTESVTGKRSLNLKLSLVRENVIEQKFLILLGNIPGFISALIKIRLD